MLTGGKKMENQMTDGAEPLVKPGIFTGQISRR
jgi:hypothetical protein